MTFENNRIYNGDVLRTLREMPAGFIHTCVTSPPYWGLRDYGQRGQLGLEDTPEKYVEKMVEVFREVRRVLRDDGTLWLNLGDSYAGGAKRNTGRNDENPEDIARRSALYQTGRPKALSGGNKPGAIEVEHGLKPKDLVGIPWRVAFALQADGWYLRSDIIWNKPNAMPESVRDRPTKAHEYIFLLSKSPKYYYDADAIREPYESKPANTLRDKNKEGYQADYVKGDRFSAGARDYYNKGGRNKRTVWNVATRPFKGAHFAVFPPDLIRPCILAGAPEGGVVLDPFFGSGTTGLVAQENGRDWIGIELNPDYIEIANSRLNDAYQLSLDLKEANE